MASELLGAVHQSVGHASALRQDCSYQPVSLLSPLFPTSIYHEPSPTLATDRRRISSRLLGLVVRHFGQPYRRHGFPLFILFSDQSRRLAKRRRVCSLLLGYRRVKCRFPWWMERRQNRPEIHVVNRLRCVRSSLVRHTVVPASVPGLRMRFSNWLRLRLSKTGSVSLGSGSRASIRSGSRIRT